MTGLHDTDIKLSDDFQLTPATDGDAPLCSDCDCLYQNIVIEALTQPGDCWYDATFGWGLLDFIQSEDDDLTRLEITQRAKEKLQKRETIIPESIVVSVSASDDVYVLRARFRFQEEDEDRALNLIISPVGVEVEAA